MQIGRGKRVAFPRVLLSISSRLVQTGCITAVVPLCWCLTKIKVRELV